MAKKLNSEQILSLEDSMSAEVKKQKNKNLESELKPREDFKKHKTSQKHKDSELAEQDFETLLQKAKEALSKLNSQDITLQESLNLYKQGMQDLKNAQRILENAKLQYQEIKD